MKFRCKECGMLFYSDEPLRLCGSCGGELEEVTPQGERVLCAERGAEIWMIHNIPQCAYFVLNNAPGNRCLFFARPRRCAVARLPEYQPRTGIVEGAKR